MARENAIRLIAYKIWEEEGCPDGRDCEHWTMAEFIWEEDNKKKTASTSTTKAVKKAPGKAARKP